jgi:hypothetical protein
MPNFGLKVNADFSEVKDFIDNIEHEERKLMDEVGQESVQYAKDTGNYHNVTWRLRKSNKYKVEKDGLVLYNDAPYASDVESRGYVVLTQAALYAEKRLRDDNGN